MIIFINNGYSKILTYEINNEIETYLFFYFNLYLLLLMCRRLLLPATPSCKRIGFAEANAAAAPRTATPAIGISNFLSANL